VKVCVTVYLVASIMIYKIVLCVCVCVCVLAEESGGTRGDITLLASISGRE